MPSDGAVCTVAEYDRGRVVKRLIALGAAAVLAVSLVLALPLFAGRLFGGTPACAATCAAGTSAPNDNYPGAVVRADNFEAGTLSGLTVQTSGTGTASVSSAQAHDGTHSAFLHATADRNSRADFSIALPSNAREVYADGWFNVTQAGTAGSNVSYFSFFSGSTRFVDVYRDNSHGQLWLRILGTSKSYTSVRLASSRVSLNAWHHLVLHVIPKGSSTTVEVWFDGASVYSSREVDTAVSSVTSVMDGTEHSAQMGDIYIDDLIVKSVAGPALPALEASFAATPTSGGAPLNVAFTDTSPGAPTSWSWDFGDGATSAVQNPNHVYSKPGTYTATLTAANAGGSKSATETITVTTLAQQMDAKAALWGLGSATSPVTSIRNGGFYRNYQHGAVISAPSKVLFVSHGGIRFEWAALGFENGVMGYPTTDEVGGLRGGGVYQNFEGGAIIWTQATGPHKSLGAIRTAWQSTGFENGVLGYPTSDVYAVPNGTAQDFQGGRISDSGGAITITHR